MVFYRRKLPHWQPEGAALFVAWRLHGSLPASVISQQSGKARTFEEHSTFPSSRFLLEDQLLDCVNFGPLWLKDPLVAGIIEEALRIGEATLRLYTLCAYVVMANHVHVLLRPRVPLEKITARLKGYTARKANRILRRTGARFWQEESYDHWVRSEEEFSRIVAYIEHNPVNARLVKRPEDWPWSSAHK